MYVLSVFLYVFPTVYLSVFLYVYPAVFLALGHGAVTVASHSPAPARGRCTCAARSLRQVCRAAAHGTSKFNQIWSARQNSGSQRQLVEARAEVSLRAEVPWQSWLAVVHEVTAEQRRPSDVEKMRSLSNRQPLMRKRFRIFLNQLHTEIQAQKINAHVYKVTKTI